MMNIVFKMMKQSDNLPSAKAHTQVRLQNSSSPRF